MKRLVTIWVVVLGVALAGSASASRLLVSPGRAVFAAPGGSAVVLQAEGACRVEVNADGKRQVFVADAEGLWSVSAVGSVPWRELREGAVAPWVATLLGAVDPKASGVRTENGIVRAFQGDAKRKLPAVEFASDRKGVVSFTVGGVEVKRTDVGPLPQLAADAFAVPGKQKKGLARLADAAKGLVASDQPKLSSTAGARGVTDEEKKLGTTYRFDLVEKIEATSVSQAEVDQFVRAGKLGGGA